MLAVLVFWQINLLKKIIIVVQNLVRIIKNISYGKDTGNTGKESY